MSDKQTIRFGTDGWRAIIADQFTFANVERVSYAIGLYVKDTYAQGHDSDIPLLVGYDTRFMADKFACRSAQVLAQMGLNVLLSNRDIPTPCIAWASQAEPTGGALMFTASHNPPEYCGVKYIPPYGGPATTDITAAITDNLKHCPDSISFKHEEPELFDPSAPYMEAIKSLVDLEKVKASGLKVAYDALYSTSRGYLDKIIRECGLTLNVMHNVRDPLFGGGMPEPKPEYLKELIFAVEAGRFDLGIATDGDSDRFAVIDNRGFFMTPNQLLCLLTMHLYKNHGMRGAIVRTVATSHMLDLLAAKYGLEIIETPVGFKYIGEKMRTADVLIGGEESGGVSIKGHIPEKDGILANLLVIEMIAYEGKPLSQIWLELEAELGVKFFQRRGDLHLTAAVQKQLLKHLEAHPIEQLLGRKLSRVNDMDGLKLYHDDDNWLLIRPSGTEPVIRVSGEGTAPELIDQLMLDFKSQIETIISGFEAEGSKPPRVSSKK
ncbi:MAG: phosphoglucomutase/phosphomannomutase family protein [Cyanobacteria bacterium SZAS LIN-3]|nr:phosphoglucomutase/phosphomannomutase family protein [Cyanobacteria bacterium SZAS LIN-3]MBS2010047.1 phosphoglucomutase/phosphomannomutase family protein [Cyanobacteria bacterium SZAS TMP-1]